MLHAPSPPVGMVAVVFQSLWLLLAGVLISVIFAVDQHFFISMLHISALTTTLFYLAFPIGDRLTDLPFPEYIVLSVTSCPPGFWYGCRRE